MNRMAITITLLVLMVGCGSEKAFHLSESTAFENFTDSNIVVQMSGNHVEIPVDSVGYLPEKTDKMATARIRVLRQVNGLWQTELETSLQLLEGDRDVIRFTLNEHGDLEMTSESVDMQAARRPFTDSITDSISED